MSLDPGLAARLKRNADGLICAVVLEHSTSEVLMVAWMNDEALDLTLKTRRATYFSRSRQELWVKGETSGHTQHVREVRIDGDRAVAKVTYHFDKTPDATSGAELTVAREDGTWKVCSPGSS